MEMGTCTSLTEKCDEINRAHDAIDSKVLHKRADTQFQRTSLIVWR